MLNDLKVKVGPQYYRYSEGAIDDVEKLLRTYKARKVLLVRGSQSWTAAEPYLTFLKSKDFSYYFHRYSGECSYVSAEKIVELVNKEQIDFIIGVGGGKLTDLVGYAANVANIRFGVIPTLASNCAPWTPLSVMYKESGESEGITESYNQQASFFLTDPKLILESPVEYFIAGIADTLAKWYESDVMTSQDEFKDELYVQLARHIAAISKETLMKDGLRAVSDMKSRKMSQAFFNCSEIVFSLAGLVGGFGDSYARNSIAHALHDGIGMYLSNSHQFLHGVKISYGILFQLALEDKWRDITQLVSYYDSLDLPKSLTEMGLYPQDENTLNAIFDFVTNQDKVNMLPYDTRKEKLVETLHQLEAFNCGIIRNYN